METILIARPQGDTNMAALIQHRCVDVRMVVSVVCAAFGRLRPMPGERMPWVKRDSPAVLHG
jgi:hypothetical protein